MGESRREADPHRAAANDDDAKVGAAGRRDGKTKKPIIMLAQSRGYFRS